MSIRYTVRLCDNGDLVDRDGIEEDLSDYIDQLYLSPRGRRPQNHTVLVKVCKKPLADNSTQSGSTSELNVTNDNTQGSVCHLERVAVTSLRGGNQPNMDGEIPKDILEGIERDAELTVSQNTTEPVEIQGSRQKRQAERNWTDGEISSGASEDGETGTDIGGASSENKTDTGTEVMIEERSETNGTKEVTEKSNEIFVNSVEPGSTEEMVENFVPLDFIQSEPDRHTLDLLDLDYNYTADDNNDTQINLSLEYDDYTYQVLFSLCVLLILLCTFIINLLSM